MKSMSIVSNKTKHNEKSVSELELNTKNTTRGEIAKNKRAAMRRAREEPRFSIQIIMYENDNAAKSS